MLTCLFYSYLNNQIAKKVFIHNSRRFSGSKKVITKAADAGINNLPKGAGLQPLSKVPPMQTPSTQPQQEMSSQGYNKPQGGFPIKPANYQTTIPIREQPAVIGYTHKSILEHTKKTAPMEQKPRLFSDELKKAENYGLIDYASAGKYDNHGSPRLTQAGYDYQRALQRLKIFSKKNETYMESDQTVPYTAGIVNIHPDTQILTPLQQHIVVVKPHSMGSDSLIGFGYLTSTSGTKIGINGVAGPSNQVIDPKTKFEGATDRGGQYCTPILPPIIIKKNDFEEKELVTEYLQDPDRLDAITRLDEITSKKEPIPYQSKGTTEENLQEINDLHEVCTSKTENIPHPQENPMLDID